MGPWLLLAVGTLVGCEPVPQTLGDAQFPDGFTFDQNEVLPPATVSFEDIPEAWPASDLDRNDVVLRYTARCDIVGTAIVRQVVNFSGVAAGAHKTNQLWLTVPGTTSEVTLALDAGAPGS